MCSQNKDSIKEDIECIATFGMLDKLYESEGILRKGRRR